MDKRFLILGDKRVSQAIVQVMNLFTSHQFECLDTSGYPNPGQSIVDLEKFKDTNEIQGLILFGIEGIELSKHIRLTDTLGRLSLLPILVVSTTPLEHLLRETRDNIILLSPEVYMIDLSVLIIDLFNAIDRIKPIESIEKMRAGLKPFIVWSEEDDIVSSHDNFNRYGPFKLVKENFGRLPEWLSKEYESMASRLWFKKYQFIESNSGLPSVASDIDEELFRKTITNKRILYIDDEHRLGWSFVLYAILTGNADHAFYQSFQSGDRLISSPDKRFVCIDSFDEASGYFESCKEAVSNALSEYSETEHIRNALSEQFAAGKQKFSEIESKYNNIKASLERSEKSFMETEARVNDLQSKFKASIDTLADAYLKGTGEPEVLELLPPAKDLANVSEQLSKEHDSLSKYREEYKRNKEILEALSNEFHAQQQSLSEAEEKKTSAVKRYDEAVKALSPTKIVPFDLIILDLRLERIKDREALPHEISGVRLLRKIKEIEPSIPVLVFTASQKAMNYKEVRELGASGYWIKARGALNSLKNELIKSLENASEFRNLWFNIRRVEVRKQLLGFSENTYTKSFEKTVVSDSKKKEIVSLLKESFLLLTRELTPYEQSICSYNNYSKIAINMGLIMEARYNNIRGDKWDQWARQNKIDKDEQRIRQLRNKAAHEAISKISYQEALEVFQKTLEKCMKN